MCAVTFKICYWGWLFEILSQCFVHLVEKAKGKFIPELIIGNF